MKIVLDTNVLVSGLLSPFGLPGAIVRLVTSAILPVCSIDLYRAGSPRGPAFPGHHP